MKPPPLLLGAAVLFWGWQSDFLAVSAVMAVALESARFVRARWEFSDGDFSRIFTFCTLLFLAAAVYAFTANEGPARFSGFFQNPTPRTQSGAGISSARTATALVRWLPMIFFPFVAAHIFSTSETIPLSAISFVLRRQKKKAKRLGKPPPGERHIHVGYPYFAGCLLAASVHAAENETFFWGLCALLAWALWAQRSRRFGFAVWATTLAAAIALGFFGQRSVTQLQRYLEHLNPQWFARFMRRGFGFDPTQSRTALGNVGDIKTSGKIVIRLETKDGSSAPTYLRAASYRSYKSPIWFAGSSREDFVRVDEDFPNSGGWNLLPGKTNATRVNLACFLDGTKNGSPAGLLPLPSGSTRLEKLPAYVLERNSAGAVLAQGPGLVAFDAFYGPGATIDSTYDTNEDLSVPPRETNALDRVISVLHLNGQDPEQALRTIRGFFADKFSYSAWQGLGRQSKTNDTPLTQFLLNTRSGHCEYFATATVLLLRQLNIPARYAVGYAVHETSGDKYIVRMRDAHAWCLVWDDKRKTWVDFDTTPASWVEAEAKRASPWQWLSDTWSRVGFEVAKFRWGQSRLRKYLLIAIVPGLALLFYQIIFRRRRRQREKPRGTIADFVEAGLDSEFYLLEKKLAERGVPRDASEPLSDWLERAAAAPELEDLRGSLRELLRLHYRYRFDPLGLSETDREALEREARECLEKLSRARKAVAAER